MAVEVKPQRLGKIRTAQYRVAVANARTRCNGAVIENLGIYYPKEEPSIIKVDSEHVQYWLGVGAQPTEPVLALLKVTGDWQKFKGLEGAEGTLKVAEPKSTKLELFNKTLEEANNGPSAEAITAKCREAKEAAKVVKEAEEAAKTAEAEAAESEVSEGAEQ